METYISKTEAAVELNKKSKLDRCDYFTSMAFIWLLSLLPGLHLSATIPLVLMNTSLVITAIKSASYFKLSIKFFRKRTTCPSFSFSLKKSKRHIVNSI